MKKAFSSIVASFVYGFFCTCCSSGLRENINKQKDQEYVNRKVNAVAEKIKCLNFHNPMSERELAISLGISEPGSYVKSGRRGFQTPWNLGGECYLIVYCENIVLSKKLVDTGYSEKYVGVQLFNKKSLIAASPNSYQLYTPYTN